jgi:hypothetical protein
MRPGFGAISDLLHVNRVEGLTPGLGVIRRVGGGVMELGLWAGYGLSDSQFKGRGTLDLEVGALTIGFRARREVRDIGDEPVISGIVNSFLAQELGYDFGDYVLLEQALGSVRTGSLGGRLLFSAGVEQARDVAVSARPATGAFRPNPRLGGPRYAVARIELSRRLSRFGVALSAEGGVARGGTRYVRVRGAGDWTARLGRMELGLSGWAGWGSRDLPLHRPFVLGGRGTLMGEPFRAWGGRHAALGRLDLRLPLPFVAVPLGSFGSTGNRVFGGPFVAAGWTGGPIPGAPWIPSQRARAVAGAQLDFFHRMLRAELGVGLRDGKLGLSVDIRRDLWSIL